MSHMSNGIKCPSCELGINRKWMGWDVVKTSTSSVSPSCEAISHLICRFAYFLQNSGARKLSNKSGEPEEKQVSQLPWRR